MSGLTVGFQGINKGDLELALRTASTPEEDKERARKILPILKKHHLLLVTLLLNNAAAMEALPIFLDALVPSWAAILLSTTAVLVFGEILPMSFFTGPSKIKVAAMLAPFVSCQIYVFYFISYPISKVLDWMFGEEHELKKYGIAELKELLKVQVIDEAHGSGELTDEELKVLQYPYTKHPRSLSLPLSSEIQQLNRL